MAYVIRPRLTDETDRRYFFPALLARIVGALALGFIYQYYYDGGDTYNYHTHGSRHIWEAFLDAPEKGIKLLFSIGSEETPVYRYSSRILFLSDPSSFMIVRIAALIDLLTFSTYSATALVFAFFGFLGSWAMFKTFYRKYPHLHKGIAIGALFIPSVIFWGSGILKDTITSGALGFALYLTDRVFVRRRFSWGALALLAFFLLLIYKIKIYILLTFLPGLIIWVLLRNFTQIKSDAVRILALPAFAVAIPVLSYFAVVKASEDNPRYNINKLAETARITAYDIRYWTGRDAGSGYSLGELDGTWQSMLRLTPQAVNVSLFRPYLWEVKNPLMLLTALESTALLALTLFMLFRSPLYFIRSLRNPDVAFCFLFSVVFAFAVGISTFNFGTLARYKIPMLPFVVIGLLVAADQINSERKLARLAATE